MKKMIITGVVGILTLLEAESAIAVAKKSYEKMSGYQSSIADTKMVLITSPKNNPNYAILSLWKR